VRQRRAEVYAAKEELGALQQRLRAGEDSPLLRMQMVSTMLELGDESQALLLLAAARKRFPDDPVLRGAAERLEASR
jgi:hypothetical protein